MTCYLCVTGREISTEKNWQKCLQKDISILSRIEGIWGVVFSVQTWRRQVETGLSVQGLGLLSWFRLNPLFSSNYCFLLWLAGCEFLRSQVFPSPLLFQGLAKYSSRGSYWTQGKTQLKPAKAHTEGIVTSLTIKTNILKVVPERHDYVGVLASDCLFFHSGLRGHCCFFESLPQGWTFSINHLYSRNKTDIFK